MRIGIDIDGVLTNIEQFSMNYFSKYCATNKIEIDIVCSNYSLAKTFHTSVEQEDQFWDEYLEFYSKTEKIRPFAAEVIKKLKQDGHEIYIITARYLTNQDSDRGENMRQIVKRWLLENEVEYDFLVFSQAVNEQKTMEIREHKIDLMIEDNPRNIKELSQIIPVICYDAGYNKECSGKNIVRCYSWYDVYGKISKRI